MEQFLEKSSAIHINTQHMTNKRGHYELQEKAYGNPFSQFISSSEIWSSSNHEKTEATWDYFYLLTLYIRKKPTTRIITK